MNKLNHTVKTIPKSNQNIVETGKTDIICILLSYCI